MTTPELIRKIEIHIETTEECMDNFSLPDYVKQLLDQEIELHKLTVEHLKNLTNSTPTPSSRE